MRTPLVFLASFALLFSGCRQHGGGGGGSFVQAYGTGDYATARERIIPLSEEKQRTQDRLLWSLDEGLVRYWAGDHEGSLEAFSRASDTVDAYEDRAVVSVRNVGAKVGSLLVNDMVKAYQGQQSDKMLLHTYKALGYLAAGGNVEAAKVELRRSAERRKQGIELSEKRLAAAEKRAGEKRINVEKTLAGREMAEAEARHYGELSRLPLYKDSANPFCVYLEAALYLSSSGGQADLEHAEKLFGTLKYLAGGNVFDRCIEAARARGSGKAPARRLVHVIFENGQAPEKTCEKIDLPLFLENSFAMVHLAFPYYTFRERPVEGLSAGPEGGKAETTALLASVDSIHGGELKAELRNIILSQILSATIKAVVEKQLSDRNVLLGLAASFVNIVVTQADTRSWETLPKEYQVALLEVPEPGRITLSAGGAVKTVAIPSSGGDILLHAKSVGKNDLACKVIQL